jgi:hypothetical protein
MTYLQGGSIKYNGSVISNLHLQEKARTTLSAARLNQDDIIVVVVVSSKNVVH